MKKLLVTVLALLSFTAQAEHGGSEGTGGGDTEAQEFVTMAYELILWLKIHPVEGVDLNRLTEKIAISVVHSTEDLLEMNGLLVDAINEPNLVPPTITINRAAWKGLNVLEHRRRMLVLHEYLGLMKVDDTKYQISQKLDQAHVCSRSVSVREYLTQYFHVSCDRILPRDLQDMTKPVEMTINGGIFVGDFEYMNSVTDLSIINYDAEIPAGAFQGLSSLKNLNFKNFNPSQYMNGLRKLVKNQFAGLPNLELLGLGGDRDEKGFATQLQEIEPGAFNGLSKLDTLDLSDTKLTHLRAGSFQGMPNLTLFFLRGHKLQSIENGAFAGLQNLEELQLDSPSKDEVSVAHASFIDGEGPWVGLQKLRNLDISASAFKNRRLTSRSFTGLSRLRFLELANFNRSNFYTPDLTISTIEPDTFFPLSNLVQLKIALDARDPASISDPRIFSGLKSLHDLLIIFPYSLIIPSTFATLKNLRMLRIFFDIFTPDSYMQDIASLTGLSCKRESYIQCQNF